MEVPCFCPTDGYKHGAVSLVPKAFFLALGREKVLGTRLGGCKLIETSVTEFCY